MPWNIGNVSNVMMDVINYKKYCLVINDQNLKDEQIDIIILTIELLELIRRQ